MENSLRMQDIMIALELIKFEIMAHAYDETIVEEEEGDYDGCR